MIFISCERRFELILSQIDRGNMASGMLSCVASSLVIFLTICFVLDSNSHYKDDSSSSVMLALKSDLKQFPSRSEIAGSSRKYSTTAQVSLSWKLRAGVYLLNTTMRASLLIMLAGDISQF